MDYNTQPCITPKDIALYILQKDMRNSQIPLIIDTLYRTHNCLLDEPYCYDCMFLLSDVRRYLLQLELSAQDKNVIASVLHDSSKSYMPCKHNNISKFCSTPVLSFDTLPLQYKNCSIEANPKLQVTHIVVQLFLRLCFGNTDVLRIYAKSIFSAIENDFGSYDCNAITAAEQIFEHFGIMLYTSNRISCSLQHISRNQTIKVKLRESVLSGTYGLL